MSRRVIIMAALLVAMLLAYGIARYKMNTPQPLTYSATMA